MFRLNQADESQGSVSAPKQTADELPIALPGAGRNWGMEGNSVGRQEQSMRKGLLGSIVVLAVNAGLAFGQMPRSNAAAGYASMGDITPVQAQVPPGGNGSALTSPSQVLSNSMYGGGDDGPYIERIWIYGQYLIWAYKPGPNPVPLITSGPMSVPATVIGGPLPGAVGVTTVFGGNNVDFGGVSGARMGVGAWLPNSDCIGWELSGLVLNQ